MILAVILAAPLVSGVTDLLTSQLKIERLLRRRFLRATIDGTWNTPLLTEHPAETARLAAPAVWRVLAATLDPEQGLVNRTFTSKDGTGPQLHGAVAGEGISHAHGTDAGRHLVLAVPHQGP